MSLDNFNFIEEEVKGTIEETDRSILEIISEKKTTDKESISSSKQIDEISQTLTLEVKAEVKKKTVEQFCEMLESDLFVDYSALFVNMKKNTQFSTGQAIFLERVSFQQILITPYFRPSRLLRHERMPIPRLPGRQFSLLDFRRK